MNRAQRRAKTEVLSAESPIPDKYYFKIGEVSRLVGVQAHVLRYWEKEVAAIRPGKSSSNQRRYKRRDVEVFREIRRLLHEERYTLAGVKRRLQAQRATEQLKKHVEPAAMRIDATQIVSDDSSPASPEPTIVTPAETQAELPLFAAASTAPEAPTPAEPLNWSPSSRDADRGGAHAALASAQHGGLTAFVMPTAGTLRRERIAKLRHGLQDLMTLAESHL